MSYDIYLAAETCDKCGRGGGIEVRYDSPTYNYGRMIREADRLAGGEGCSFEAVNGVAAEVAIRWFRAVLAEVRGNEAKIRALAPDNGWGTYEDLDKIFTDYIRLCEENPKAVWETLGSRARGRRCSGGWVCGEPE